jgi:hypothetical protein
MADIVQPQTVRFSNEKGRVMADTAEQLYQTAKRFQQEWAALITAVGVVPNTPDQIADGAHATLGNSADGRKPMTGAQLNNCKALADAMVTWFETGAPTRIVQLQQFSVNGAAKF